MASIETTPETDALSEHRLRISGKYRVTSSRLIQPRPAWRIPLRVDRCMVGVDGSPTGRRTPHHGLEGAVTERSRPSYG